MKAKLVPLMTLIMVLSMIASPAIASPLAETAQPPAPTAAPEPQAAPVFQAANAQGPALYIVQLQDASLASYTGGKAGLPATSPEATGARKLDANSPASVAYLDYLEAQQAAAISSISTLLGRPLDVAFQYLAVLNAFAATMSPDEAAMVAKLPEVRNVWRDVERELETEVGPPHIGAPAIWNAQTGSGSGTRGEGVIIGVIDSGINSQHPSFAATDGDGYTHTNPYGAGVFKGWCVANPAFCNSKLVGAYGFNPNGGSPEDTDGHGSHTASTSGGNKHTATFNVGPTAYNIDISGVAPRANIVAYKVCNPSCPGTASIAAVNSAIANDQVDVLNYSISGSDSPWTDPVDIAFLDASNAGIFVSASAGNTGPGASTVAKTGPWNAAVAASTINRVIANTLDVTGPTTPANLQGLTAVPGENTSILADVTAPIRYNPANNDGCVAFSAGYFSGAMALIQRGGCTFLVKINNAAAAGAVGVIIFNNVGGPPISMGGGLPANPPAFMLDLVDGTALRDYIIANPTAAARVNVATSYLVNDDWEDIVAGFSSRGPSQYELLKPDYIAPGVNILAATAAAGGNPAQYEFMQGTSMSSPHGAGAAALMVGLHPSWTPAEVKSAMASTATGGLLKEDGVTPADPFDVGSGLLALGGAGAVGLVMNETGANYAAANPAIGGDPKTLNQPSMVSYNCAGTCSWTRTVESTLPMTATYTAVTSAPAGMTITVTPNSFSIPPGGSQQLTITANVGGLPLNAYAFGSVTLETDAVWPPSRSASAVDLLNEQFTDTTFPPTGWASYKLSGAGTATWIRTTAQFSSSPASARRTFGGSGDGFQDDWLVTPSLTLGSGASALSFIDAGQWMNDYVYSGVMVSTGSCNPADGAFVELAEVDDTPGPTGTVTWRAAPLTLDLSAYADQTICVAFRYSGTFAHAWWIDDVVVTSEPASNVPVTDSTLPVVVRPTSSVPAINVTPNSLAATQPPDTTTNQAMTIANVGTAPLIWQIAEAPLAMRIELNASGPDAPDAPVMLAVDDGVGENAIGLTAGGQFLWLNRFSPTAGQFPVVLDRVDIMFGYPAGGAGGVNVGELVDIYLYEDADGNPANGAVHRASLTNQAVQAVNGTTWSTYNLAAPVSFTGPGDILIAVVNRTAGVAAGTFPAVIDQTPPSQQRSWAGFGAVPGNPPVLPLPTFGIIDSFGLAGNWLVRGFGTAAAACDNPADVPWLSVAPTGGTTNAGGSSNVSVGFDSTGLAVGAYNAVLCVTSNDPQNPLVEVPVTLTVQEQGGNVVEICRLPNVPIPDNTAAAPGSVSDTLNVAADLTILDMDVYIRAPHTWVGDLAFTLQHVNSGTTATLIDRPGRPPGPPGSPFGCSGDNYDVWVNDEGPDTAIEDQCANLPAITGNAPGGDPTGPVLSVFDGLSTQGDWVLTATDNATGDTGTLAEWCVRVTVPAAGDPNIDVDPLSMASTQAPNTTTNQTLDVSNTGGADLTWNIFEQATAAPELADWSDNFDSYATGSQLHGQGGWKGWQNDPSAGALTSSAQARSAPNSAAIVGASDLVHEYGETDGQWVYTAWQYVPTDFTGQSYFIMLNTYTDGGNFNWSTQVMFDGATNTVINDGGVSGGTLPLVRGQWVEIRLEIDLDADTGAFYYNNQLLYSGTWSGQVSGGGATSIGAVDLFANGASVVYYDDMSLVNVSGPAVCDAPSDIPWASVSPTNGTTAPGATTPVQVTFDSTGLALGTYTGNLCVDSNDPDFGPGNGTALVVVPLRLVVEGAAPNIDVDPLSMSSTQPTNTTTQQMLDVGNTGDADLTWTIEEEPASVLVQANAASPALPASAPESVGSRGAPSGGPAPFAYTSLADFSEGFEDVTNLPGWFFQNNSAPLGVTDWFQGNDGVFPAHAGSTTSYIGANFNNTDGTGTISNWMLTPVLNLNNGDTISFWTRTPTGSIWPDRLELRLSTAGASTNVGTLATDVGDFTTLLLSVNGGLVQFGYPEVWTQFSATLIGLSGGETGRFAFRYFVTGGGPSGNNSNYIGIDTVEYVSAGEPGVCDAPADVPWLSVNPTNGTTAPAAVTPVQVTFDSTGLAVGTYNANLCVRSNDPDPGPGNETDLVIVPVELVVTEPSNPAIELVKTVGTDPGVCAPSSNITVPAGTEVYYCYTVTNTGDVTLNWHDLDDSELGNIFMGLGYALTPGSSVSTVDAGLVIPAIITMPTLNVATWTAYNVGGAEVFAQATAFVDVIYFSCQNPQEDFENGVPPWGWSVVNNVPGGPTWGDIGSCGPNGNGGNWTGGLGNAACISASTLVAGAYDAELRSPLFSLVGYSNSTISFLMNYQNWGGIDELNFDISTDGGGTWAPLRVWTTDQGAFQNTPGVYITTDLEDYLGMANLMLRWRYHWNSPQALGWYAQIDEAEFKCVQIPPTAVTLDSLQASPAGAAGSLPLLALPALVSLALGAAYALRRRAE